MQARASPFDCAAPSQGHVTGALSRQLSKRALMDGNASFFTQVRFQKSCAARMVRITEASSAGVKEDAEARIASSLGPVSVASWYCELSAIRLPWATRATRATGDPTRPLWYFLPQGSLSPRPRDLATCDQCRSQRPF